jgi:hypothetical protein
MRLLRGEEWLTELKPNGRRNAERLVATACLLCCLLICGASVARGQKKSAKARATALQGNAPSTPDQLLKLGFFYYNNDDISDKAAAQFRAVIARDPGSNAAETAQYYLGSYYQRKYYVQQAKFGKPDRQALEMAKREYRAYTDRYYKTGTHQWLADAFFNLALVLLQQNDARNAGYELNKLNEAASLDNSVYIYQVVYSTNSADILDGYFPSGPLANYTASLLYGGKVQGFNQQAAAIKDWCRSQNPKQAR